AVKKCMSAGKENSRSKSRIRPATQKPSLRPMERIDKPAAVSDVSRARKSTSSVPRGRSSTSPSEVRRIASDLRGNTSFHGPSAVAKGKSSSLSEKKSNSKLMNVSGDVSQENEKMKIASVGNSTDEKKNDLNMILKLVNDLSIENQVSNTSGEIFDESGTKSRKKRELQVHIRCKKDIEKPISASASDIESSDRPKRRPSSSLSNSSSRQNSVHKYPSKLHEKLAHLEGKVKQIASDIKRTKEMLDMNNTDASKMILSDIQEKISGIEKAMVHVVKKGEDVKRGCSNKACENSDEGNKAEMNVNKLEDRLFPHHRLMRDRKTILKPSGSGDSGTKLSADAVSLETLSSSRKTEENVSPDSNKVQEMDESVASTAAIRSAALNLLCGKDEVNSLLISDENLNDFDQENENNDIALDEEDDKDNSSSMQNDIGSKPATAGWFVSEGDGVLLAHGDGSCSFYDIANDEVYIYNVGRFHSIIKAEYKPPPSIFPNLWRDCWIIRAPGSDGCSAKYVVAASAGNSGESGFCSWDFYSKNIRAFHFKSDDWNLRTVLAPLPTNNTSRTSSFTAFENWYRPCGPLIVSASSSQRKVRVFDIRDGDEVMQWELNKPVLAMDYSSPLQWRNRGKVVITESDSISLWDVASLNSQALLSIPSLRRTSAIYVNNTDAEFGGGIRQRISSRDSEGNDGVFCTCDSINVLDFRQPTGIGLRIPKIGFSMHSAFCHGNDAVYIGCTGLTSSSASKKPLSSIQQYSIRKQKLVCSYTLPETNAHRKSTEPAQVWGNDANYVMGICDLGLFVFDSLKDDGVIQQQQQQYSTTGKEVTGRDDLYSPCFDYCSSRVLIISRDRPASWRYL
ncbi:hypothetical protein M569_12796, partial [Genlisea aurea]